jgi:hypothetical protein
MKASQLRQLIREEVRKVLNEEDYSDQVDRIEAKAKQFIENPALEPYITNNDMYGFAIMEVPVDKLEMAMKMKIENILAMDEGMLSISLDQNTNTVDIILARTSSEYEF